MIVPTVLNLLINNKYYQVYHHGYNYSYYLYSGHPDFRNVNICGKHRKLMVDWPSPFLFSPKSPKLEWLPVYGCLMWWKYQPTLRSWHAYSFTKGGKEALENTQSILMMPSTPWPEPCIMDPLAFLILNWYCIFLINVLPTSWTKLNLVSCCF